MIWQRARDWSEAKSGVTIPLRGTYNPGPLESVALGLKLTGKDYLCVDIADGVFVTGVRKITNGRYSTVANVPDEVDNHATRITEAQIAMALNDTQRGERMVLRAGDRKIVIAGSVDDDRGYFLTKLLLNQVEPSVKQSASEKLRSFENLTGVNNFDESISKRFAQALTGETGNYFILEETRGRNRFMFEATNIPGVESYLRETVKRK